MILWQGWMRRTADRIRQEEFLLLLGQTKAPLERFCRAISPDRDSAADLAAEVVARAFEKFDSVREKQAFPSFLFTIASRAASERRRKAKRFVPLLPTTERSDSGEQTEQTEAAIDAEYLYSLLDRLPESQRETVILFEISGLSLEKIREIQGGSVSGVKSRLVRGRASLSEMLRSDERSIIARQEPMNSVPLNSSSTILKTPIPERLRFNRQA